MRLVSSVKRGYTHTDTKLDESTDFFVEIFESEGEVTESWSVGGGECPTPSHQYKSRDNGCVCVGGGGGGGCEMGGIKESHSRGIYSGTSLIRKTPP